MRLSRSLSVLVLAVLLPSLRLPAQQAPAPTKPALVVFRFDWKQGIPWLDYAFTVQEDGTTHFNGTGNPVESGDGDSLQQDFVMSQANAQNVFQWAKATDYFQGQFESKTKNVAKTGTKTLEYHGPSLDTSASYNYSPNPNIQQLTRLFQAIAVTLDYGRRLAYQYRFDKLGMDTRLKELVDLKNNGQAEELQAIEPILRKIADDDNMLHVARIQAKQLLKAAGPDSSASKPPVSQP
jgi:hypothetical protein